VKNCEQKKSSTLTPNPVSPKYLQLTSPSTETQVTSLRSVIMLQSDSAISLCRRRVNDAPVDMVFRLHSVCETVTICPSCEVIGWQCQPQDRSEHCTTVATQLCVQFNWAASCNLRGYRAVVLCSSAISCCKVWTSTSNVRLSGILTGVLGISSFCTGQLLNRTYITKLSLPYKSFSVRH
jgi:hypothetical protein